MNLGVRPQSRALLPSPIYLIPFPALNTPWCETSNMPWCPVLSNTPLSLNTHLFSHPCNASGFSSFHCCCIARSRSLRVTLETQLSGSRLSSEHWRHFFVQHLIARGCVINSFASSNHQDMCMTKRSSRSARQGFEIHKKLLSTYEKASI